LRQGFTLFELLVVLLVISILASIGVSSYVHIISRADRQKATLVLWQLSSALAVYAEAHHASYTGVTLTALGVDFQAAPHYQFQIVSLTETRFVLIAIADGIQAHRDGCKKLILTDVDQRVRCGESTPQPS